MLKRFNKLGLVLAGIGMLATIGLSTRAYADVLPVNGKCPAGYQLTHWPTGDVCLWKVSQ